MSVIQFKEVVAQISAVAEAMGETIEQNLNDYAPSIIGQHGGSVVVIISDGDELWNQELERVVREQVESFSDPTGAPCTLTVDRKQ